MGMCRRDLYCSGKPYAACRVVEEVDQGTNGRGLPPIAIASKFLVQQRTFDFDGISEVD